MGKRAEKREQSQEREERNLGKRKGARYRMRV